MVRGGGRGRDASECNVKGEEGGLLCYEEKSELFELGDIEGDIA